MPREDGFGAARRGARGVRGGGAQNEKVPISTEVKVEFVNRLSATGLRNVETTSFVSKKWVPQMGDATEVLGAITRRPGVVYSALTPNMKGLEAAIEARASEVAIFAAASDAFSMKNINCNVLESFERFEPVCRKAAEVGIPVRGYISTVLGCPYQGPIEPDAVGFVAARLMEMGCYEVSLGDTIGVGTPIATQKMLAAVLRHVPLEAVAVHFHDTYAMALPNLLASLEMGVAVVDSSCSGLGGCPYAKGASGNVATEDVVYMLHGMGIHTGIDLDQLIDVGVFINQHLGREPISKVAKAMLAKRAAASASASASATATSASSTGSTQQQQQQSAASTAVDCSTPAPPASARAVARQ
jgi:hydroxymethylglutaryl-CoA lyase